MSYESCTLQDVAKAAGVSTITVSRAFSGTAPVAKATKRRIQEKSKLLGYVPNILARGLRGGRTQTIGIFRSLTMTTGFRQSSGIVHDLMQRIQNRSYAVNLADHSDDPDTSIRMLDDFAGRGGDGIIFSGASSLYDDPRVRDRLSRFSAAVAITGEYEDGSFDQIIHDRQDAVKQVAEHFVASGRKKPVCMGSINYKKMQWFFERLRELGIEQAENSVIDAELELFHSQDIRSYCSHLDSAVAMLGRRFPEGVGFDAIFCSNDDMAVTAMHWLRDKGLRVPEDVAVVGFDDDPISRHACPPLASVTREDSRVNELAEDMLFSRLDDADLPRRTERVEMRFVCRKSAG